ncbi:DUF6931 family protein [Limobrevibacterium gyesilva]|uniref:Uncharacterized protein n=1 Tax=Limobrevibacterium gyesilva TaxID=2991712 RepID=A0AA41YIT9_9PROT|nr:hypothetical protein [Limobrevibacterium gyesilva]MCW3473904.1 hypothetical protein [Limobrevibacterium gyesilva]
MAQMQLMKMQAARIDDVLARLDLPAPTSALLAGCEDAAAAFVALEAKGLLADASKWAAHALPKREAVWWACMCTRHTAPADQPAAERGLVQAAEQWVRKPTDENRRAAFALAQEAGFTTPEAWAAVAAFWSGESMSPLGQPVVPPPPDAAGRAVAGAVALAAVRIHPERHADRLTKFLQSARDIAGGGPGHIGPEEP